MFLDSVCVGDFKNTFLVKIGQKLSYRDRNRYLYGPRTLSLFKPLKIAPNLLSAKYVGPYGMFLHSVCGGDSRNNFFCETFAKIELSP